MYRSIKIYDEDYGIIKQIARAEKRPIIAQISVIVEYFAPRVSKKMTRKLAEELVCMSRKTRKSIYSKNLFARQRNALKKL